MFLFSFIISKCRKNPSQFGSTGIGNADSIYVKRVHACLQLSENNCTYIQYFV